MNIPSPRNKNIAENIWFIDAVCVASPVTRPVISVPAPIANIPARIKHKKVRLKIIFLFMNYYFI